ncbi:TPA: hypothetical protein ACY4J4_001677 [Enterococcus faecium]
MLRNILKKLLPQQDTEHRHIAYRSNVIQYDEMGYPLRYVIMNDKEHIWIDTVEQEGDVVLQWEDTE